MSFSIFRRASLGALLLTAACAAPSACSSPGSTSDPTPPLPGPSLQVGEAGDRVADPREVVLSQAVALLLKRQHLSKQEINDALSQKSYTHFLEMVDRDKLFFLQEDVDALKKSELKFDDELLSGNLRIAHEASDIFILRLKNVQANVATYLAAPLVLTTEEFRETDSEKLAYAKTDTELAARWGRVLKLEILARVSRMELRTESLTKAIAEAKTDLKGKKQTADEAEAHTKKVETLKKALAKIPTDDQARIVKAQADLQKSYSARFVRLLDVDALTPAANFINAITGSFDPHTVYMPPQERENFDISMSGSLEGIGAVLIEQDHFIGVNEVVVGGASWKQGDLEAGDLILSVTQEGEDTVDIGDMKINKVVKMIRGPKGTTVSLTVEKEDKSIKTISIVRDKVSIKESYARGVTIIGDKGQPPVGYIYLPSFYGQTRGRPTADARFSADDVKKLLAIYQQRKIGGLVIDLRSNGGGLLDDARKMTGYFIKDGPVVQTQLPDGTVEVLSDTDSDVQYTGKVVVLIDRFSASASEIVAAALQDYGRAVIVGAGPTHGKGTVQGLLSLDQANQSPDDPPLGVLKLTVQQFFRINGSSTQRRGVTPDIPFPDSFKHLETGERDLDNALPWREVKPLPFDAWSAQWSKEQLLAQSLKRQSKSRFFKSLEKRSELMKARRDDSRIPLRRKDYEARNKKQLDEAKALSPDDDDKRKPFFRAEPVEYTPTPADPAEKKAEAAKLATWTKNLTRDPVVNESLQILRDMQ